MQNTDSDKRPKRPIVHSYTTATRMVETWMTQNYMAYPVDGEGMKWKPRAQIELKPKTSDPNAVLWHVQLWFDGNASGPELMTQGVLDKITDERLISLIGDHRIQFKQKSISFTAKDEEEVKTRYVREFPLALQNLNNTPLRMIKRQIIGRWIEKSRVFGGDFD